MIGSQSQVSALALVGQIIDFKTALLVNKSLHGLAPKYISYMIEPYDPSQTLRISGRGLLRKPRVRTKCGEAAFQFYGANFWNSLSEGVREVSTLDMFKSNPVHMKTKGILSALLILI